MSLSSVALCWFKEFLYFSKNSKSCMKKILEFIFPNFQFF